MFENLTHDWLEEALLDKMIHRLKHRHYPNRKYLNEQSIWRRWLCN